MNLNQEKQKIIATKGNVLVTANPGTGKTLLLAGKYIDLLKKGIYPEKILCLTFTDKAKGEMDKGIIKAIKEEKIEIDYAKLNIYTFHSYCMQNIEDADIVSPNLLRFAIYKYLTENDILEYGDDYLIETIVPKIENSIRYLKSFGIMPDVVDLKEAKGFIEDTEKYTKEQLETFLEHFVNIFKHYESIKSGKGYDYADLLIEFLKLKKIPKFDYVLVDELQDVNSMEADIALKSGETFFVVGDKKQAIFGFQGGSILNFDKFSDSTALVLSENFRSTNPILDFSRKYFDLRSKDETAKKELRSLKNPSSSDGPKPCLYEAEKSDMVSKVCQLISGLSGETAIIARTNYQLIAIANEFKNKGISFSSTTYSASDEAKANIISFLKGVLSNDIPDIKNSMFSPFFPIKIQLAFELAKDKDLTLEKIYLDCPEYKRLREGVSNIADINIIFQERIFPIAITYGKEYLAAAMKMQEACKESFNVISDIDMDNLVVFLRSADLLSSETEAEAKLVLTTIHKSKGRQFDTVIYIPSKTKESKSFVDAIVGAILCSKHINAKEELEEEDIRVNFVAFTRAKKELHILTDKTEEYLNNNCALCSISSASLSEMQIDEKRKKAFSLFVNGEFESAKEMLASDNKWLIDFVSHYFTSLDHISVTSLSDSAYDYFIKKILKHETFSKAVSIGTSVHDIAEKIVASETVEVSSDIAPFVDNVHKILAEIKKKYPTAVETEFKIDLPLKKIIPTDDEINFLGYIDAIFTNGSEYLIVDWKTDRDTKNDSKHRQQLEAYKRAYSLMKNIPLEKIKVAIAFIGLRNRISDGKVNCLFDDRQPQKTAFETFSKRVNKLLSWRKDTLQFFKDMIDEDVKDDVIWRIVKEQWERENLCPCDAKYFHK